MDLKKPRRELAAAQAEAKHAEGVLDKAKEALSRGLARKQFVQAEIAVTEGDNLAEARRMADAFVAGNDAPISGSDLKRRFDLELQETRVDAAIEVLRSDVAGAETALDNSRAGVERAINAVIAAHIEGVLEQAHRRFAELRALAALLTSANSQGIRVAGVQQFLNALNLNIPPVAPEFKSAAALLRSWRSELTTSADAEPDLAAAEALEKADDDRLAARDAEERRVAEEFRATMTDMRRAAARGEREEIEAKMLARGVDIRPTNFSPWSPDLSDGLG